MTRLPAVIAALLLPVSALAQGASDAVADRAPLLPVWAMIGVILLATLLALLFSRPRTGAHPHPIALPRRRRETPS
ncbi:MAG: hypothetical protein ACJ79R_02205 [Anaeromyxobacteraceae bacterium]